MPRPPLHNDYRVALLVLRELEVGYAEALRQLVPVAERLGVPRPSYTSVRRIMLAHRRRARDTVALAGVAGTALGALATATVLRVSKHKPLGPRAVLRLRE
jgi:uncharacterized membrane protein